jgi:hypothetical protein
MDFAYSFDGEPKKVEGKSAVLGWLRTFKSEKTQAAT